MNCFIKKPNIEEFLLQIQVEYQVWNQFELQNYAKNWSSLQCFCIFNRFCDQKMKISPQISSFLLKSDIQEWLDINKFYSFIFNSSNCDNLIQKHFDDFVKDVQYEDFLAKLKLKNEVNFTRKMVLVTSNYVFVSTALSKEDFYMHLINVSPIQIKKFCSN